MSSHAKNRTKEDIDSIHQYYMEIINSMPNIVYWIDTECNLKGCNHNFVKLLGLNTLNDLKGSPYQQMEESAHWDKERIEELKLDDMKVIFSGIPQHHVEEKPISDSAGKLHYFQSSRVPMYNRNRKIIGLIVILNDITLNKELETHVGEFQENSQKLEHTLKEGYLPTVLMVEDNIIAQNVEKALLTALHCHVDIADSAESAVNLFYPGKYDLVLMDIGLEDSSGYVVAKQLRQKEKNTNHHVPIIALTGFEADVVKYDCQHYFMEGAISKPLTCEQAEQIIKHYVYHMDVPVRGLKTT
ncbi:response regulator [Fluoribacter dumoffii]|uniref:Aerobic respiration control sensor protein ArcB n=1 Tax=Fluoribacter dumoffii TaxID=463 RepID=A0A377GAW6_9GAMM|nr:response regulator [Fluoribacter dumoffii]KTC90358.1 response regulator [Fluoribacter dumoffii NY 23]MCW8385675.1 response regulator [Fluoribacter dumoffii]MCW8418705.1 response regulator [Fluoribacter dumoffii]MCW8453451.1 response regulator [Fluoribacter dumoffii]MCW8459329.1 response regulator [Fluoribacter dumoffii]